MTVASSPERHTFQDTKPELAEFWEKVRKDDLEKLNDPEWRENNLEYDLRATEWVVAKAREREGYAQNIYAALCNMRWQRHDVMPILKDEYWSCSWRSAGGIVADMLGKGDYIDWYCSGIHQRWDDADAQNNDPYYINGFVPEGVVTDEIEDDFYKLGWTPSPWPDDGVI